jgi:HPr kinase/phosphorylase
MSISQSTTAHGVFMSVFETGVFIIGKSGVGKSDLALSLLDRGHAFIADDIVEFSSVEGSYLTGRSPPLLKNFLEIRGLGVIDVAALFGPKALLKQKQLSLVIELEKSISLSREMGVNNGAPWSLLGVTVPCFSLPVDEGRPREVLLEVLVRNYQLTQKGCDANRDFLVNHQRAMSIPA